MDLILNRDTQHGIEIAWHKKTIVPEDGILRPEVVYPYQIDLAPVYYPGAPGEMIQSRGFVKHNGWVVPVATDDFLPVGNGRPVNMDSYTAEGPHENWAFAESVLAGTKYRVVSAGSVQNRSKFFVSAKLDELESLTLVDGSTFELILNAFGSLDQTLNKFIGMSGTRTVCYNTLMFNFLNKEKFQIKYRHSKNMAARVEKDRPVIEAAVGFGAVVKAAFDRLVKNPIGKDDARAIYAGFIAKPAGSGVHPLKVKEGAWPDELSTRAANMVEEHVFAFEHGDGNNGDHEFDLLNGWTQPRTRGYQESDKDKFDVYASSEFGSYADSKSDFARLLTDTKARAEVLPVILEKGRELLKTV